jgi:hypothetical protein
MDAAVAVAKPVGLLVGQAGLKETGTWCDEIAMWRRHLELSDGTPSTKRCTLLRTKS